MPRDPQDVPLDALQGAVGQDDVGDPELGATLERHAAGARLVIRRRERHHLPAQHAEGVHRLAHLAQQGGRDAVGRGEDLELWLLAELRVPAPLEHRDGLAGAVAGDVEEVQPEADRGAFGVRPHRHRAVVHGSHREPAVLPGVLDDLAQAGVPALLAATDADQPAAPVPGDDVLERHVGVDSAQDAQLLGEDGQRARVGAQVRLEHRDEWLATGGPLSLALLGGDLRQALEGAQEGGEGLVDGGRPPRRGIHGLILPPGPTAGRPRSARGPRRPSTDVRRAAGGEVLRADHLEQRQRLGGRGPGLRRVDDHPLLGVGQLKVVAVERDQTQTQL